MGIGYVKRLANYKKKHPIELTPKQRRRLMKKNHRDIKILSTNKD